MNEQQERCRCGCGELADWVNADGAWVKFHWRRPCRSPEEYTNWQATVVGKNRVKAREYQRRLRSEQLESYRHAARRRHLAAYGLTHESYDELLTSQGGGCAICRTTDPRHGRSRKLHVDHDHATGRVRGLLCSACNKALGYMQDDPERLRRAADYLS